MGAIGCEMCPARERGTDLLSEFTCGVCYEVLLKARTPLDDLLCEYLDVDAGA